jgi:2-polyprenyl-3-methyl-5-hydroxy-6-metoxy-1,4-benzoquinol methylase
VQFRNLFLMLSKQFPRLQQRSESFWRQAGNSYLAPSPAVYEAREQALREALAKIVPVQRAMDVGCGDGRFTLLLGDAAEHVYGYDISEPLISEAKQQALRDSSGRFEFHLAELEEVPIEPAHGIVSCLGVTSCVLDEAKFGRVLDRIVKATAEGGHLLLVDTLSDGKEATRAYRNGYVAKYRQRAAYERALTTRGLALVDRRKLADMGGDLGNFFYVLRRDS